MVYQCCPIKYRLNCKNYELKCNNCKAKDSESANGFYYKPINDIGEHPYIILNKQSSEKGKSYRNKGRNNEKRIINKLSGIPNKSSIGNDGYISLIENDYLSLEIKTRVEGNRPWPSKLEWDKAMSKGIDVFVVDSDKDTRVCMSMDTFNKLINYIKEYKEYL
jgi:hypothetical protein